MRALVLSGGGMHGAFQVGALEYLIRHQKRKYNAYCGISVGAINCGHLAMYEPRSAMSAFRKLKKMWQVLDNSQVRKHWIPFGPLHALWTKSYYNSSPLKDLIYNNVRPEKLKSSGNELRIGAVSLQTGEYRVFDQNYGNVRDAILASAAFPMMLNPIEMEGQLWVDGGARDVTPIKSAIDLGADEIDVIMTSPLELPKKYKDYKTISIGLRTIDIVYDEIIENDIKIARLINELVGAGRAPGKREVKINVYRPTDVLPGSTLDFDPKMIKREMSMGFKQTARIFAT